MIKVKEENENDISKSIYSDTTMHLNCEHCDEEYEMDFGKLKFQFTGGLRFLCTNCNKINSMIGAIGVKNIERYRQLIDLADNFNKRRESETE